MATTRQVIKNPRKKKIKKAKIRELEFGIGKRTDTVINSKFGVQKFNSTILKKTKVLALIKYEIRDKFIVDKNLENKINDNILKKVSINCYQGKRHQQRLPVHGQRTKTNKKTQQSMVRVRNGSNINRNE